MATGAGLGVLLQAINRIEIVPNKNADSVFKILIYCSSTATRCLFIT
jgi:hypothetical protein